MLLLEHARGGWMNVYYGNLELLDDIKARWFAKVQRTYFALQSFGRTFTFGGLPGNEVPYGFCSVGADGSLYTVVNPSQSVQAVQLPRVQRFQEPLHSGRIQFRDAGFLPELVQDHITLGPEQLAVIGFGEYAKRAYDLGVEEDVLIPKSVTSLRADIFNQTTNCITTVVHVPAQKSLRIIMRQFRNGHPLRTSRGAPPNGVKLGQILQIQVTQNGQTLPVSINYDKAIWSGLSWGVGEVKAGEMKPGQPVTVTCTSHETNPVKLEVQLEAVDVNIR
jgi:hypothetical protein